MIELPPGWRPSHHGDALRRRLGPAWLQIFRKRDRGGYFLSAEWRRDCRDPAESCAPRDGVEAASPATHRAVRRGAARWGTCRGSVMEGAGANPERAGIRPGTAHHPLSREIFARYSAHACAASNLHDG